MGSRDLVVLALLLVPAAAGCLGSGPVDQLAAGGRDPLEVRDDGTLRIDVPVQVVLIGFEDGVADALAARLEPLPVQGFTSADPQLPPPVPDDPSIPDPDRPLGVAEQPLPYVPVARFDVREAPADLVAGFYHHLERHRAGGAATPTYNATAAEHWLAEELPRHGFELDRDTPSLVLVHGGDTLPDGHAYNYTMRNGWIQPVRAFGERYPFVAMDVSARPDPWAVNGSYPAGPYDRPLPTGGSGTVSALEEAVHNATRSRLLQSPVFPVSTKPCTAVTVVLAVRSGSLTQKLPGYDRAEDLVDVPRLESSWARALGKERLHVDLHVVHLPQDDPVLDSLLRGYIGTFSQIAWWLDENWDRYWVEHEGCSPVLSVAIEGDPASTWDAGYGMYSGSLDRRIALSWSSDWYQLLWQYSGPEGDTLRSSNPYHQPNVEEYDVLTGVVGHETGHAVGLHHTHNSWYVAPNGTYVRDDVAGFSSVRAAMSYHLVGQTAQLGAFDWATVQRARAGVLAGQAVEAGLQDEPGVQAAFDHLRRQEWSQASHDLRRALEVGT